MALRSSLLGSLLVLIFVLVMPQAFAEQNGEKIYHDYCSVCHGDQGDGQSRAQRGLIPAPRDFTTPQAAVDLPRKRMMAVVRNGKPGTAMTGWAKRLTEGEIESVVDYIRDTFMMSSTTDELRTGRRLYAEYCSVCHGDKGQGSVWAQSGLNPAPVNFTEPASIQRLNRDRMIFSVTYGRPETAMSGWGRRLTSEDVASVVDYVRSAFMGLADVDSAVPEAAAAKIEAGQAADMPNGLQGNAAIGGGLYQSNCAECHGVSGDGQGPRAYFIFPKPRNFQQPAVKAKYSRGFLFEAISKGRLRSEMPAWDKVWTDQQIADVAEYVYEVIINPSAIPDAGL
ncbi:MAG: c-type cytochrome [Porticoccus sp.]